MRMPQEVVIESVIRDDGRKEEKNVVVGTPSRALIKPQARRSCGTASAKLSVKVKH